MKITLLAAVTLALARGGDRYDDATVVEAPPETLRETGLYGDWDHKQIAPANRSFSPQYPLWSDGAKKQRWVYLPPGTAITSTNDVWRFPIGTRLWKEFSFGARAETRYMVNTAAGWRFATYVWSADGREAVRAPRGGVSSVAIAPGTFHQIPGEGDCQACHGNGPTPVLGFSALQLSADRDPNAVHGEPRGELDLPALLAAKQLHGITHDAPRIPGSPLQRAALGYLHANCGHCHRSEGAVAALGMVLAHGDPPRALPTTLAQPSKFMAPLARIAAGDPEHSVVLARMSSRSPLEQMPPLGTQLVDDAAVSLLRQWIAELGKGGLP